MNDSKLPKQDMTPGELRTMLVELHLLEFMRANDIMPSEVLAAMSRHLVGFGEHARKMFDAERETMKEEEVANILSGFTEIATVADKLPGMAAPLERAGI